MTETRANAAYPVHVDGVLAGHVYRQGYSWCARGLDEPQSTDHHTRASAEDRLARMVEVRHVVALEQERRERARTEAPDGWRFAAWVDIQPGDIVRAPHRCVPVAPGDQGDDAPLSPESFSRPVTLTRVEHLGNGAVLVAGQQEDDQEPYVLLVTPRFANVGALAPDEDATP